MPRSESRGYQVHYRRIAHLKLLVRPTLRVATFVCLGQASVWLACDTFGGYLIVSANIIALTHPAARNQAKCRYEPKSTLVVSVCNPSYVSNHFFASRRWFEPDACSKPNRSRSRHQRSQSQRPKLGFNECGNSQITRLPIRSTRQPTATTTTTTTLKLVTAAAVATVRMIRISRLCGFISRRACGKRAIVRARFRR